MKKIVSVLFLLILTAGIACTAGCVFEKPNYVVGIHESLSPWEYYDTAGNPAGVDVEVMNLVADIQGFTVTYVPMNTGWEEALENGEIDIESGLVSIPAYQERFICTKPLYAPMRYAVAADADSGVTLDQVLAGDVRIALMKGSTHDMWAKAHFGAEKYAEMVADGRLILKDTVDAVPYSVLKSEADAAIAGDISIGEMLTYYQPLCFVGFVGVPLEGCMCVRKNDTQLRDLLNEGADKIENTPEFAEIVSRYNLMYKKPVYLMGIDDDNLPWTDIESDGKIVGYDIEQMQWIADRNNFALEFVPLNWKEVTNAVVSGKVDLFASSLSITDKRLEKMAFSHPYYSSSIGVAVRHGSDLTMKDFDAPSAKIATIVDSVYDEWVKEYLGEEMYTIKIMDGTLRLMESENREFQNSLIQGTSDFGVCGVAQFAPYEEKEIIELIYEEKDAAKVGVAMRNGDLILQDMVNSGLAAFEASGEQAKLMQKYNL